MRKLIIDIYPPVTRQKIQKTSLIWQCRWSLALILLMILNVVFINTVVTTAAYYLDTEVSTGNTYTAGKVDFTLSQTPYLPPETVINLMPGAITSTTIKVIPEPDSNSFWYQASSTNFGTDLDFCETLGLKSYLEGIENYSGSLSSFLSPATTTLADWQFDISTTVNSYNKICTFDFEFSAWQSRHNLSDFNARGFSDIEKVKNMIKSASKGFRINKVYYDVDSIHGNEGDNEWVEIYNQTDSVLDLAGWQICDNNACDTMSASSPLTIPAQGFAVITASSTTWKYWDLPSGVVKIELGSNIGNGLGNDGDELVLKRSDGVVVDEMNWQTNTDVWDPGAVDVPEGHMLGRKPNGYDTDQPSDFVDLALPVVLLINPNQSGNQVWYWTHTYNITWNATNPNGPDSDIKVNLYYIKDTDGSMTITDDDETVIIATNLTNSGNYSWQVPSVFLGYIWVKIVAVGPENPMLNARMISGKIWDPSPLELLLTDPDIVWENILDIMTSATTTDLLATTTEIVIGGSSITSLPEASTTPPAADLEVATTTPTIVESAPISDAEIDIATSTESESIAVPPVEEESLTNDLPPPPTLELEPTPTLTPAEVGEEPIIITEPEMFIEPESTPEVLPASEPSSLPEGETP